MKCRRTITFLVFVIVLSLLCSLWRFLSVNFQSEGKPALMATARLSPNSAVASNWKAETLPFSTPDIRFQIRVHPGRDMSEFDYDRGLPQLERVWPYPPDQVNALQYGAKSKITLIIVDSRTNAVANAEVQVHPVLHDVPRKELNTVSDENGRVEIEDRKASEYYINIRKDGYYPTHTHLSLHVPGLDCVRDGKWQPWNPTLVMTLKERRDPGELMHRTIKGNIPVGETCFVDLINGSFLPPHGGGVFSNMAFCITGHKEKIDGLPHYKSPWRIHQECRVSVSDGGGFVRVLKDIWSMYRYVYEAPESGYDGELVERYDSDGQADTRQDTGLTDGEYYIFRFRDNPGGGIGTG